MINTHGTGLVLDGHGVLLRGRSGAGKSLLALELLDDFKMRGKAANLIADDRIDLEVASSAIVMHAPIDIAGLIELRGRGIVTRPSVPSARLHLVIDLGEELTRYLEEDELFTELEGIKLPFCPVPERGVVDSAHQRLLVREALSMLPAASKPKASSAGAAPRPKK